MSLTSPSKPIAYVDIPEVKINTSSFVYNFFMRDESVSDKPRFVISHGTEVEIDIKQQLSSKIIKKVPRYVAINFQAIDRIQENITATENNTEETISIFDNFDRIMLEHNFSGLQFTGLAFQDSTIDQKLSELLSGSLSIKLNAVSNKPIYAAKPSEPFFYEQQASLLETAKYLNKKSKFNAAKNIDVQLNPYESGYVYINGQKRKSQNVFEGIKNIEIQLQLDNNIVYDAVRSAINDPLTIYSDELLGLIDRYRKIQDPFNAGWNEGEGVQPAVWNNGGGGTTLIAESDYDALTYFVSIEKEAGLGSSQFQHKRQIVGYVADKFQILPDGTYKKMNPVIIENPNATQLYDPSIKYGARYSYQLRTIALVTFEAVAVNPPKPNDDDVYIVKALVSSRPTRSIVIDCVENVPPAPPSDFKVSWDYSVNRPRLTWNFPVTLQRDVKQFQIFRRLNIDEPFKLVRQYDFDDSVLKLPNNETPDPLLVKELDGPRTVFIDEDFNKESSSYIYAVCCIDAHGYSSNYSTQFKVWFNSFKNKIERKLISPSNAPKSLPNLFLQEDAFIDTIKTSGFEYVKVYFEPEYLKIFKRAEEESPGILGSGGKLIPKDEIPFLSTDIKNGRYVLQLINTDLQKQKSVTITLKDERKLL
jgi:hypothetical protein